jgi:hypothetical protein
MFVVRWCTSAIKNTAKDMGDLNDQRELSFKKF